jgi:hypothetical protein
MKNKKEKIEIPPNFRNAIVVRLIMVSVQEGQGTEDDPYRLVHYFLDFDGNLIFKKDKLKDEK